MSLRIPNLSTKSTVIQYYSPILFFFLLVYSTYNICRKNVL
nr:MAG TPA: hypothetical protein [Caudoviricetes sp.]